MVIYTKRGDKGETSAFDNEGTQRVRIAKDSLIVEALGAIDELNSFLGVVKSEVKDKKIKKIIDLIQRNLLTIGSITGGSGLIFSKTHTSKLEKLIDDLEGNLPVLKNFVVPGGTAASAKLQYARALTRRAERRMVSLSKVSKIKPQVLEYLNRLSDAVFMLARYVNNVEGIKDDLWVGRRK